MGAFTQDALVATPDASWGGSDAFLTAIPLLTLAVGVWLLEQQKRSDAVVGGLTWLAVMRTYAKEIVALVACSAFIAFLVLRGEHMGSPVSPGDEAWADIKREWPILMTADTLLALQAILRLVLLVSVSCRSSTGSSIPLALEAATFMFLAAVVRVTLLMLTPENLYQLDGPLGGKLNLAFEVSAIPFLLCLSRHMLNVGRRSALLLIAGTLLSVWAASCNQLNLASEEKDAYLDALFTFEHLLESCAAVAIFVRTAASWNSSSTCTGPAATIAHVILPAQQLLAAYFLLVAFSQPFEFPPELTRVGHPLQLLRVAGVTQVGLYLLAAALHFTDFPDTHEATGERLEV